MKIFLLLLSFKIYAIDLDKNPIYAQILKNKPKINKQYAYKLSNCIHKAFIKYNIPKNIYAAILAQESGYILNTKNKITGLYEGEPTTVIIDFGISQINWRNLKRYDFDVDKLTTDMLYSVMAGAKILAEFKNRYSKKEKYWWTRYYSSNKIRRNEYRKLVERYL